jgi:hypothetical protein
MFSSMSVHAVDADKTAVTFRAIRKGCTKSRCSTKVRESTLNIHLSRDDKMSYEFVSSMGTRTKMAGSANGWIRNDEATLSKSDEALS